MRKALFVLMALVLALAIPATAVAAPPTPFKATVDPMVTIDATGAPGCSGVVTQLSLLRYQVEDETLAGIITQDATEPALRGALVTTVHDSRITVTPRGLIAGTLEGAFTIAQPGTGIISGTVKGVIAGRLDPVTGAVSVRDAGQWKVTSVVGFDGVSLPTRGIWNGEFIGNLIPPGVVPTCPLGGFFLQGTINFQGLTR
jgi:hypothetical protein